MTDEERVAQLVDAAEQVADKIGDLLDNLDMAVCIAAVSFTMKTLIPDQCTPEQAKEFLGMMANAAFIDWMESVNADTQH